MGHMILFKKLFVLFLHFEIFTDFNPLTQAPRHGFQSGVGGGGMGTKKKSSNLPENVAHHGWATKKILVSRVSRMASKSISGNNSH